MLRTHLLASVALCALATACGADTGTGAPPPPPASAQLPAPTATVTSGPRHTGTGIEQPPPFTVRYDAHELVLRPHTYCYANGCVDGYAEHPPTVGSPASVAVYVPVEGFGLQAFFTDESRRCGGRVQEADVQDLGEGWYRLTPQGPAGHYRVGLFAQGGGDMAADFLWDTPTDGPLAVPRATMAVIADHDGRPDSYGFELSLSNLARTPRSVRAVVTVTAGNGRSTTFEATRPRPGRCATEGSVFFDGPDDAALEASRLGDFPFTHRVVLTIDGTRHVATATFPDDQIEGEEPGMRLSFQPPLF
jgi:hypothetical protein